MINYVPTPTGLKFHREWNQYFIRGVCGPFGSGKTTMCIQELMYAAMRQPVVNNRRYMKWGFIRSTYAQLKDITRLSILECFSENYGTLSRGTPLIGLFEMPLIDGTIAQIELEGWALDDENDADKIRSTNWTGAWLSEPTEIHPKIIEVVTGRIGRFPSAAYGGAPWSGIIMDFNKPPTDHWLDLWMKHHPENYKFYVQPPAAFKRERNGEIYYETNPDAENLNILGPNYYQNQIDALLHNGNRDQIDSLFCLLDVPAKFGQPVFPDFKRDIHVAPKKVERQQYCTTVMGIDTSGIHPAAVFFQMIQGVWYQVDELFAIGVGFETFCDTILNPFLRQNYGTCDLIAAADPADARNNWTEVRPTEKLKAMGIQVWEETSNTLNDRIPIVNTLLNRRQGGIMFCPSCTHTIEAMAGKYHYRKINVTGSVEAAFKEKPEKNVASHTADAVQYACQYILGSQKEVQIDYNLVQKLHKRRQTTAKIM